MPGPCLESGWLLKIKEREETDRKAKKQKEGEYQCSRVYLLQYDGQLHVPSKEFSDGTKGNTEKENTELEGSQKISNDCDRMLVPRKPEAKK